MSIGVDTAPAKTITVTVSLSTNPAVAGRYFADLRDTTNNRNHQMTNITRDADEIRTWIGQIEGLAARRDITVTVTDTTGELAL